MTSDKKRISHICKIISEGDDGIICAVIEQIRSDPLSSDDASKILACCDPNNMRHPLFKQLVRVALKFGAKFDKRRFDLRIVDRQLRLLGNAWVRSHTDAVTDAIRCWKLINKEQLKSSLSSRKRWIDKLSKLAYGGIYQVACELIRIGKSSNFELTSDEATNILDCCGPDIRYSFCKRLLRLGAEFNNDIITHANSFIKYLTKTIDVSSDSAENDFKRDSLAGWKLVDTVQPQT